ncbi:hypothetical protein C7C46_15935 [Streptomyces tateyamensis]|uniref:DUF3885 domain-containing protein n=1 Tax=Streptomyces tateyamensis TaxID=565073 RepID=A0A2V4N6K3_9ACTN|nr:hypothetical protein [Streptomyces tateyamensis]PYC78629.1 hypothetical protein C7C46_15935 [Streptomyces tateyamensis]
MRFHSLPESKRYAEDEAEYATVLGRYNAVLDELFAGGEVYVITPAFTASPDVPSHQSGADHWQTLVVQEDFDPEFRSYAHLFVVRRAWQHGCLDGLLREVADDQVAGVLVTDLQLLRLHHPYDGGADVFLPTTEERDRLRERHAGWLSRYPGGL